MTTFETGKTYQARSIGDHNCIFTFKVIKRTEKTITIFSGGPVAQEFARFLRAELYFGELYGSARNSRWLTLLSEFLW